jgi:cardiolipin synthase
MRWSWLPNAITILRMLMAAPLSWLILRGDHHHALWVALVVGGSDALDGVLAKRFGWESRLGGILDPLADKLMLLACYVSLGILGDLPAWLVALVLGRDLVIVSGALAYHRWVGPLQAAPTRISKVTTAAQIVLVLWSLVDGLDGVTLPATLGEGLLVAVAVLTAASGLHYVLTWSAKARRDLRGRERT